MSLVDNPDTDAPLRFARVDDNGEARWIEEE